MILWPQSLVLILLQHSIMPFYGLWEKRQVGRVAFGDHVGVGDVWWVRRCSSLSAITQNWMIFYFNYDKLRLVCLAKLLFYLTNIICHNSNVFVFFFIISEIRSHEVHRKGRDWGSLWHPRRQRLIQIWSLLVPKKQDGHGSNANLEIWLTSHWLCRLFMMQSTVCSSRFLKIVAEIKYCEFSTNQKC